MHHDESPILNISKIQNSNFLRFVKPPRSPIVEETSPNDYRMPRVNISSGILIQSRERSLIGTSFPYLDSHLVEITGDKIEYLPYKLGKVESAEEARKI